MGFGQFDRYILSFQEQTNTVRSHEILCIAQQLRQRRAGPGGYHVKGLGRCVFHALIAYLHRKLHPLGSSLQKSAFLGRGLKKGDRQPLAQKLCQNQARKACTAAQIGQGMGFGWDKGGKLGAVPGMPPPDFAQGRSGNQIMPGIPVGQQVHMGLEPGQCFT